MGQLTPFVKLAILAAVMACGASAMARTIPVYFGVGTKIVHVATLSRQTRGELGPNYGEDHALGYGYETIAFFGLDIWTWSGGYCIYSGRNCDEISAARTAEVLGIGEDRLPRPWSYMLPPGLIVIVLALTGWYAYARRRRQLAEAQPRASDDPRYQRALALVMEGTKKLPLGEQAVLARDRFSLGVDYLVDNGVDHEEAARVLVGLVDTLLDFRRRTAGHM